MGLTWLKTPYPGVRYREHPTRRLRNGQTDKYYTIRFKVKGASREEALGWASQGWNAEKAYGILAGLKNNATTGEGPASLADKRREQAEAEALRKAREEEEARAERVALMTLGRFFDDHYLPLAKQDKRSWKADESRFRIHILPVLGRALLRTATTDRIQELIDNLRGKCSPATIKHVMAVLRRMFNVAMRTRIDGVTIFSGQNPASGLRLPPVVNARDRFLSVEEVDSLLNKAKEVKDMDVHDAAVLSVNTGLRIGEIVRLAWNDIDFTHGFITVREEDRRKPGGSVPMNDEVTVMLRQRQKGTAGKHPFVFPSRTGMRDATALSHGFKQVADAAGLNNGIDLKDRKRLAVFHTLRHTFASWLALKGTDIYRIKILMRHKTIAMTMRYAHLIPDATREAVHNLRPPKKG